MHLVDVCSFKSQVPFKTPSAFYFILLIYSNGYCFFPWDCMKLGVLWCIGFIFIIPCVRFHLPQHNHHYFCSLYTLSHSFSASWNSLNFSCCFSVFVQHLLTASPSECVCAALWKWACLGCQAVSPLGLRVYSLTGKHQSTVVPAKEVGLPLQFFFSFMWALTLGVYILLQNCTSGFLYVQERKGARGHCSVSIM